MYLKSTILEGLVEGLLEGLQLIGLYSGHVGFCMYIAPPRTSLRGNPPASLSNQDYDFLCMTVAEALVRTESAGGFKSRKVDSCAYLVIWEDQRLGQNDIFSSASSKNNNLCNVVWCQWLAARVDRVSFGFVASKSDDREFLCTKSQSVDDSRRDDCR